MEVAEGCEILESVAVVMDPTLDGFVGVLLEPVFDEEWYMLTETGLGYSNRLLLFRSGDETNLRALLGGALGRRPYGPRCVS